MTNSVLILGGTSDIAHAWARVRAAQGATFTLVGRNQGKLDRVEADLSARSGNGCESFQFDLAAMDERAMEELSARTYQQIFLSFGTMISQEAVDADPKTLDGMFQVNVLAYARWLRWSQQQLKRTGGGQIIILGSVAGDCARRANFWYGTTKAAQHFMAKGLALESQDSRVSVVLVKPGPTDTAMTAGMQKGGPLWASPEVVANAIDKGAKRGRRVVYAPARWRWIMWVFRSLPFFVLRKMRQ